MTKISQLSSIGDSLAVDDQFLIRDVSDGSTPNKSVTVSGITRALDVGTAAAPAIAFATDKNTGIYSPGADQVAISTGGSGRLFVDSSGRVGIGGSPSTALHLGGSSSQTIRINSNTSAGFVGTTGYITQIAANRNPIDGSIVNTGTATAFINLEADVSNGSIQFCTTGTSNAAALERMRITSAGLVGIGTSAPQSIFHIGANAPANAGVKAYTALANSYEGLLFDYYYNTSASNRRVFDVVALGAGAGGAIGGSDIRFLTVPASATGTPLEAMRIDSAQRVGIGTTSPQEELHIAAASQPYIQVESTGGVAGSAFYGYNSSTGSASIESTGSIRFAIPSSEAARIDSSGRLLVGTTTTGNGESRVGVKGDQTAGGQGVMHIENTASSSGDDSPPLTISKARTTTTSSARFVQFYAGGGATTPMGGIVGNGASNVQFASISDIRDKENIQPLNGSLQKIKTLEVVSYDWKNSGEHVKAGFIAQNVETVFPEYVVENMASDGDEPRKGITGGLSSGYVAVLTAALQEAVAKIETLEARLTAAGID